MTSRSPFWSLAFGIILLCLSPAVEAANRACYEKLIPLHVLENPMQRYLEKLRSTTWEGVKPFGYLKGKKLYMSRDFELLTLDQKKDVLELLLLDYGAYQPLLKLREKPLQPPEPQGAMAPFEVYTSDGRIISYPYNACNRLTVLTEYERERLSFLGINIKRIQRYPLARWRQEQVKKLFWEQVGYEKAGDYWIAWVPEQGHFEINLPLTRYETLLAPFFKVAPAYYYHVVGAEQQGVTFYQGKKVE